MFIALIYVVLVCDPVMGDNGAFVSDLFSCNNFIECFDIGKNEFIIKKFFNLLTARPEISQILSRNPFSKPENTQVK